VLKEAPAAFLIDATLMLKKRPLSHFIRTLVLHQIVFRFLRIRFTVLIDLPFDLKGRSYSVPLGVAHIQRRQLHGLIVIP
jgi:hypothetical protein